MALNRPKLQKASGNRFFPKLILIALGGLLLIFHPASSQPPKETRRVLILITGQMGVPGYELSREGIQAALDQSTEFKFEYFIEYMDRYRFRDVSYLENLRNLYQIKYSDKQIDLIIAHGAHALDIVAAYGQDFLPDAPVVFSAVLKEHLQKINLDQKFIGSLLEIDYLGLLNSALNNHPDTQHVVVITGTSKVGRFIDKNAREAYAPYAEKYDFIYLGHLEMNAMLDRLATLPGHSVVIYYITMLDGSQKEYKPWEVASKISTAANAPTYGMADTYLGKGIVGGKMFSYEALGRKAAYWGLRILKGENLADMNASAEGTHLLMFDWRQLKRWSINENTLPPGSIVRFRETSLWDLYKWYIIGGICLFFAQGLLIFRLSVQRRAILTREQRIQSSDNRFRAFMDNSLEGIWCAEFDEPIDIELPEDEQFELVYKHGYLSEANDAYAKNVGFKKGKDLIGARIESFCPRSEPQNVTTVKAWIKGQYRIVDAETVETFQDGVTRVVLNNSIPIIESNRVLRVWGTHSDITERKQAEEKLIRAEQKYRTVADYTYDWEYWRMPDGRLEYVSPSCERITGYGPAEFIERPELLFEVIVPEDQKVWTDHLPGFVSDTKPTLHHHCHFRIQHKNGDIRWIAHICRPVYNPQGGYEGVRASNRDITALRKSEQKVREHHNLLAHLERKEHLGQLTGSIAHELNQPLTGILSNAQAGELLLERERQPNTQIREILADIVSDTKRASTVIKNLRGLFSDTQENSFKTLDINAVISETLQILNSEFISRHVTIYTDPSAKIPDVSANRIQLQQVLINLIKNSWQVLDQTEPTDRRISISTSLANNSQVAVCLEDSGPGIDPGRLKDIFEPLVTTKKSGMGMGLAISKSIVQQHGGRIWAENNPRGGARIQFTIPARR